MPHLTMHLDEAASLFNLPTRTFIIRHIHSGELQLTPLRQLPLADVLDVYDRTPQRKKRLWRRDTPKNF